MSAELVAVLVAGALGVVAVGLSLLLRRRYARRMTRRWVDALKAGDGGTARALEVAAAANGVDVRLEVERSIDWLETRVTDRED